MTSKNSSHPTHSGHSKGFRTLCQELETKTKHLFSYDITVRLCGSESVEGKVCRGAKPAQSAATEVTEFEKSLERFKITFIQHYEVPVIDSVLSAGLGLGPESRVRTSLVRVNLINEQGNHSFRTPGDRAPLSFG